MILMFPKETYQKLKVVEGGTGYERGRAKKKGKKANAPIHIVKGREVARSKAQRRWGIQKEKGKSKKGGPTQAPMNL